MTILHHLSQSRIPSSWNTDVPSIRTDLSLSLARSSTSSSWNRPGRSAIIVRCITRDPEEQVRTLPCRADVKEKELVWFRWALASPVITLQQKTETGRYPCVYTLYEMTLKTSKSATKTEFNLCSGEAPLCEAFPHFVPF